MTDATSLAQFAWAAMGWVLGVSWFYRLLENVAGMRQVDDIAHEQFAIEPDRELPSLRVVVPARNEEDSIEQCLRTLLAAAYPKLEIIAVDDRSTDATGSIMDRVALSTDSRKLRVIHVTELPPGWLGKTHAMWLGAKQENLDPANPSSSEWILFTDGDIFFQRDSLRRAVAYAESHDADHFGLVPSLILTGFGERMVMSFFMTMFALAQRPWRVADKQTKDFIGIGAFNLIRREVYEKLGTYQALRMEVLDDLKMGQEVKRAGFAQRTAFGRGLIKLRWGRGAFGILGNMTKNLFALVRFRVWLALALVGGMVFFGLGPFVGLFLAHGLAKLGYILAILAIFLLYANMSQFNEIPLVYAFTYPVSCVLIMFAILRSTISALARGGIVWRGTKYPLRELREHLR